jgi:uncharacterized protein (DUF486 family)
MAGRIFELAGVKILWQAVPKITLEIFVLFSILYLEKIEN